MAALVSAAAGQAVQPPAAEPVESTAGASDISLDLVVHDKRNKPVVDLKPEEIAITDNGTPVKLTDLRLVTGKQETGNLVTLVFDRPVRVDGASNPTDPSMTRKVRETANKILKSFPERGFSFAVMNVEGRLRLQQGFTSDRKALEQAMVAATEPAKAAGSTVNEQEKQLIAVALTGLDQSGKTVSAADRALAKVLFAALNNSGRIAQDQHLRPSLAALLALAQSQQQVTQRKAVIYFTSMQDKLIDSHAREAIETIIGTANQAGLSVYVVDMNSLDSTGSQMSAMEAQGPLPDTMPGKGQQFSVTRGGNDDMQHLAGETGGSYITGDGLRKSLDQLIEDMTTYYVASYPSTNNGFDGKFRPVTVKPLRAGIRIRTQTGYFALAPGSGTAGNPQPFELQLLKIFDEAPLPADVSFRASVLHLGQLAEGNVHLVAIEVPLSSLDLHADSATSIYSAHVAIIAVVKDKSGTVVERFSADIPRRGLLKTEKTASMDAITFQRHFLAPPGQYVLEAAILDRNSGKEGAQRIAFDVPATSGTPSLSGMVLVREVVPGGANDNPLDSLRNGKDMVIPNVSGKLPSAKDVSIFFVAHSDIHAAEAATLKVVVSRDGKPLGGAPILSRPATGSESSSYLTSFSIDPPVDGAYEVRAFLSQGGKTAEASTSFTLAGAELAGGAGAATEVDSAPLQDASRPVGPLVVTLPPNPLKRPPEEELKSILADATRHAVVYGESLPNFMCERVTNRSVDQDGTGRWKHKDKFTELLTYVDRQESRSMLEIEQDGVKTHADTATASGVQSAGEFGAVISGIFRPASKAKFEWKETGALGDGTVQIFDYRVARENSNLNLRVSATEVVAVGFHGQVLIDTATRSVRRISQIVDDPPKRFPIHATFVSVDYDYVAINNHDYLLPVGAQIILRKGGREKDLNEIEFRNYRRFGSTMRILDYIPEAKGH